MAENEQRKKDGKEPINFQKHDTMKNDTNEFFDSLYDDLFGKRGRVIPDAKKKFDTPAPFDKKKPAKKAKKAKKYGQKTKKKSMSIMDEMADFFDSFF